MNTDQMSANEYGRWALENCCPGGVFLPPEFFFPTDTEDRWPFSPKSHLVIGVAYDDSDAKRKIAEVKSVLPDTFRMQLGADAVAPPKVVTYTLHPPSRWPFYLLYAYLAFFAAVVTARQIGWMR